MTPLPITHATLTTALGAGMDAHVRALREQRCGLTPCSFEDVELPGWIGRAAALEEQAVDTTLAGPVTPAASATKRASDAVLCVLE